MQWDDLRYYLAAVRAGSYTAAGRRLGVNRTTVGRRIEALEETLGVPLFRYTPTGPEPTPQGAYLLEAAGRIETEVDAMRERLCPEAQNGGLVRIAGSAGIVSEFVPDLLAFGEEMPGIAIEVLGELDPVDAVTHRRADLGLAILRKPPRRVAGVEIATLSQARYALRGGKRLQALGWGHEVDALLPGQWIAANPSGVEAEARGLMTFNSWPQMKQAVLSGFGSAKLWCFAADAETSLERLEEPDPKDDYPLWLVHRAKAPPSPALRGLIAFLQDRLGARLTAQSPQRESSS
ncbi:LysR family transcriptional regulator [Novosphingobium mathurense]|uniref:Transcriptional regulator, LysR family n=1 Tax=Novosphingobium mathurense TaxID=428990 RepID=A0A1U6HY61_9SPHN|nr:LysR family transcriptional regulator [Novosphingobium mathurense]SLK00709.1 transcriptional regulator, LysR family [Novosphingobium mathurense]